MIFDSERQVRNYFEGAGASDDAILVAVSMWTALKAATAEHGWCGRRCGHGCEPAQASDCDPPSFTTTAMVPVDMTVHWEIRK